MHRFRLQKGGVGKSTLTVLAASWLHYLHGIRVAVVDCNYRSTPSSNSRTATRPSCNLRRSTADSSFRSPRTKG